MYYFNFLSSYAFTTVNNVIMREINCFLFAYVILFKCENFRQHRPISAAGAKGY